MPYNQQYLDWKAGKNGYDWVDCLNFILIGSAEATDAKLTTGEINKIKQINEITFSHWVGEDMPYLPDEPDKKLKKELDLYFSIIENSRENNINNEVQKQMNKVAQWIKTQDWFNSTFAESIISWLVEIAKSDGNIISNEKESINSLAEFFDVEKPF